MKLKFNIKVNVKFHLEAYLNIKNVEFWTAASELASALLGLFL